VRSLDEAVADYLTVRRAFGFKLERHGRLLPQFVDYLDDVGATTVTVDHAIGFATLPPAGRANAWAERLSVVRGFACWLAAHDPTVEIPPADVLPWRPRRATPYLFSDSDIAALLEATDTIRTPFRAATYATLLGLLTVTGMRVGEALALDRADLDLNCDVLIVRAGKFGKTRQLPLHETTVDALTRYLARRDRPAPASGVAALLVSTAGTRLIYRNVSTTFRRLVDHVGLAPHPGGRPPRLHDLRHTFVVNTVLDAYRTGADLPARLPALSTYLGHIDPANTYWYLSAAPELLALAATRLHQAGEGRP
jgi:integrase